MYSELFGAVAGNNRVSADCAHAYRLGNVLCRSGLILIKRNGLLLLFLVCKRVGELNASACRLELDIVEICADVYVSAGCVQAELLRGDFSDFDSAAGGVYFELLKGPERQVHRDGVALGGLASENAEAEALLEGQRLSGKHRAEFR